MQQPETTNSCAHRESGRNCPISKTPCLGECIYANILDDISLGIIGLDREKQEVFFQNKQAVEIFRDSISPKDYQALSALLLTNLDKTESPSLSGESYTITFGNRFLGYSIYTISDSLLWIYLSDITEKTRLNAIAEAVNTMNNLGYIFSGIRHELGNPINALKTSITVCRKNLRDYSKETIQEFFDRMLTDITRVEELLRDLKNFSLYEHPECGDVNIVSFMENLLSIVKRDFSAHKIRIRTMLRQGAEHGYFDARALQHVMLNILTNAFDALEGSEDPVITISSLRSGERVFLTVSDNGKGIPSEQMKHLFMPFSTTKSHGTGLGLVIVKKMLLKMDGTINIESLEKVGTTVTIDLPAGKDGHA